MAKELVKQVSFSIDGEFLANFARTRLKEGAYQHALEIVDCLEGLPLEEQILILKGKKTLVGSNNEIELVVADNDIQEDMELWHQSHYGSIFKYENKLYKPYAYVSRWSRDDIPTDDSLFSSTSKSFAQEYEGKQVSKMYTSGKDKFFKGHIHSRSLYYADNPREDIALTVSGKEIDFKGWDNQATVLFKEVREQIPFWATEYYATTPLESVQRFYEQNRYLSQYGASSHDMESVVNQDKPSNSTYRLSEEEEEQYWKEYDEDVAKTTQQVIDFANNDKEYGWKEISDPDNSEHVLKVPYRAFLHFAVGRHKRGPNALELDLPSYTPFFSSGMKSGSDDPFHTDAWVGAGLSLDSAYDDKTWQYQLFFKALYQCQAEHFGNSDFYILNSAQQSSFRGTTVNIHNYETVPKGQRILVLPHLGIEFDTIARQCDAIIAEQGGKLAHLVTVGRENGLPIVRMEDAVLRFAFPAEFSFDLDNMKIQKHSNIKKKNKP